MSDKGDETGPDAESDSPDSAAAPDQPQSAADSAADEPEPEADKSEATEPEPEADKSEATEPEPEADAPEPEADESAAGERGRWAWLRGRGARRTGGIALRVGLAAGGAVVGLLVGAHTTADIGPVTANLSVVPLGSTAELAVPPIASIDLDAYDGPLGVRAQVVDVDGLAAIELAKDKTKLKALEGQVGDDVRDAVIWLVIKSALFALGGAALFALLAFRWRWREPLIAAGIALVLLAGSAGLGAATWRQQALSEMTVKGLLSQAPTLLSGLETKFASYREGVTKMVGNISKLYSTVSTLPADTADDSIRLLHVSDLHLNPEGFDLIGQLVTQFHVQAVLDTGDLVDWGSPPESQTFTQSIGQLGVPYVYIKGNHDSPGTVQAVAGLPNAVVLDNSATTIEGIQIVGIGDPRFSADKSTNDKDPTVVKSYGKQLASYVATLPTPPGIAMVHDPNAAGALAGKVPLVLSGHTHKRAIKDLGHETTLMVEGSTGGAGLRGLEHPKPTPLSATVLYFDPTTKALQAYDEVTVGGLGQTDVTIQRHIVDPGGQPAPEGTVDSPPVPSGTSTPDGGAGGDPGGGSGGDSGSDGDGSGDGSDEEPAGLAPVPTG